jgi:hypothetical protein
MDRACSTNAEKRNALLLGNSEEKRPLRRPRSRWVDNIEMDLREIGWGDIDWSDLAQDRVQWRYLVKKVMKLWGPIKCLKMFEWLHN